jgi:hypothetical protein
MGPFTFEEFINLRFKKTTHLSLKTELHEMRNMKQLGDSINSCVVFLLGCAGLVGREYWVRAYWWCGK